MANIIEDRIAARIEGDFVVFLIGMRINRMLKIWKWLPTAMAMQRMLTELERLGPEQTGFLGYSSLSVGGMIQYWRSFEHLEAYARAAEMEHRPAWAAFNRRMKGARGDVGIWHETYLVQAGNYECVYTGMPLFGLAKAGDHVPATGQRAEARGRLTGL